MTPAGIILTILFITFANRFGAYLDSFSNEGWFDIVFGEWGMTCIAAALALYLNLLLFVWPS